MQSLLAFESPYTINHLHPRRRQPVIDAKKSHVMRQAQSNSSAFWQSWLSDFLK